MGHITENISRQIKTGYKILPAAQVKTTGAGAPTLIAFPLTIGQQFTVDNDYIVVKYRKPADWVPGSNIIFGLNWTKSQDTDQSGNKIKWQLEYFFVDIGDDISIATPDATLTVEQTYIDAGTTTHIGYTANIEITSENVSDTKDYFYIKLSTITPSELTLIEPVLLTICMQYDAYLY